MIDAEVARASAVLAPEKFPRNAIGLDSWANVHVIHQKDKKKNGEYTETLNLASGFCKCRREVGRKGVPRVYVPHVSTGDNIDLFPEGFLWERGCTVHRGETHIDYSEEEDISYTDVGHVTIHLQDDL